MLKRPKMHSYIEILKIGLAPQVGEVQLFQKTLEKKSTKSKKQFLSPLAPRMQFPARVDIQILTPEKIRSESSSPS